MPDGLTQLAYIESIGTQYIDTGFKPNQDTSVEMGLAGTEPTGYWFGAWNVKHDDGAYAFCNDTSSTESGVYVGYDGQGGTSGSNVSNGKHVVKLDKNIAYVDDVAVRTYNYTNFQVNYNLYLFAQNRAGKAFIPSSNNAIKCTYCKIWDNGRLVRDFVPCKRDSDGAVGMYDRVSGQFFGNAGTGNFVAGGGYYGNLISGTDAYSGSTGWHYMTAEYFAETGTYKLTNMWETSSDPNAIIEGQTVYLEAGNVYKMHANVSVGAGGIGNSGEGGGVKIYYGINSSFTESNALFFSLGDDGWQYFSVDTSGTYNLRFDNELNFTVGATVYVRNFVILPAAVDVGAYVLLDTMDISDCATGGSNVNHYFDKRVSASGLKVGDVIETTAIVEWSGVTLTSGQNCRVNIQSYGNVTGWDYSGRILNMAISLTSASGSKTTTSRQTVTAEMLKNDYWAFYPAVEYVVGGTILVKNYTVKIVSHA